jgi:DNA-binding CsgD family transcriptional regulator
MLSISATDYLALDDEIDARLRPAEIISLTVKRLGLRNAAYVRCDSCGAQIDFVQTAYPSEWLDLYTSKNYQAIDPVMKKARNSILPIDWKSAALESPKFARFVDEARELGLGPNGLTVPIHGPRGDGGVFSIAADLPPSGWKDFKKLLSPAITMTACHIQSAMMDAYADDGVCLSPKEIECLKWAAEGKTSADIGDILSVSDRTVRFHLDNARGKLGCINVTHTVARALMMRLIPNQMWRPRPK